MDCPEVITEKHLPPGSLVLTIQLIGDRIWTADVSRIIRVYDANVRTLHQM